MTEPGTPLRPEHGPSAEPTGSGEPGALPTRRSLRSHRDETAGASALTVPAIHWPAPGQLDDRQMRAETAPVGADAPAAAEASGIPPVPIAPAEITQSLSARAAVVNHGADDDLRMPARESATTASLDDGGAAIPPTPTSRRDARQTSTGHTVGRRPKLALPALPPVPKVAVPRPRRGAKNLFAALIVVPGIFLTVALPAYAFTPGSADAEFAESASHIMSEEGAQSVDVSSAAAKITVARDGYVAVSGEEVRRIAREAERAAQAQAAAERRARAGGYSVPGQRAEGDDYPWAFNSQGVLSPLGYYYRECVDFVAWRLNRDAGATGPWRWVWSNMTPGGGSAWNWANAWEANGWAISHDPIVGAVAWFPYNHVAYVQAVNGDGTVTIEEYNQQGDHMYHRRTLAVGDVALYLYPPPR